MMKKLFLLIGLLVFLVPSSVYAEETTLHCNCYEALGADVEDLTTDCGLYNQLKIKIDIEDKKFIAKTDFSTSLRKNEFEFELETLNISDDILQGSKNFFGEWIYENDGTKWREVLGYDFELDRYSGVLYFSISGSRKLSESCGKKIWISSCTKYSEFYTNSFEYQCKKIDKLL
tara:strand:- start:167 stop:688 length:522 start_codon:yes stop_codon:yes gene_type:complete